jgi:hypothetical protein
MGLLHSAVSRTGTAVGDQTPDEARLATVLPGFYCPSRRAADVYPCVNSEVYAPKAELVAKSDYAANAGDHDEPNAAGPGQLFVQPETLEQGDDSAWWAMQGVVLDSNGLVFQRSSVRMADIPDGTAHTYLVGEKSLDPEHYTSGAGLGDMESVYHGDDDDTRVTFPGDWPPGATRPAWPAAPCSEVRTPRVATWRWLMARSTRSTTGSTSKPTGGWATAAMCPVRTLTIVH